jgi:uncharacterized membrane protein
MFVLFVALVLLGAWAWSRINELRDEVAYLRREVERLAARINTPSGQQRPTELSQPAMSTERVTPAPASGPPVKTAERHREVLRPSANVLPISAQPAAAPVTNLEPVISPAFEQKLGTNWLNKVGAALLVIGVASFLTYQVRNVGPLGKDLIGVAVGALLLTGGIVAERRSQYVIFSRGVMAAGWALLYFIAFAAYHIPAARVVDSKVLDLLLMLLVATGMVIHAMRYRSEAAAAMAFLFAFGTVALGRETAFTVPAILILAAASTTIAISLRWALFDAGAIAATYINHSLWLSALESHGTGAVGRDFLLSLALLIVYWSMFRASYIVGGRQSDSENRLAALGAVVNTLGFVIVGAQHPLDRGLEFAALVVLGSADLLFARVVRARPIALSTLVTVGVTTIAAAFPVFFDARVVSVAWLLESEALILLGARSGVVLFSRLGIAGSAITAVHLLASVSTLAARRVAFELPPTDLELAMVCALASGIYYGNSIAVRRRLTVGARQTPEQFFADKLSYAGALFLLSALWAGVPMAWLAPTLIAGALVLVVLGRRLAFVDLWGQGHALAFFGLWTLLVVNAGDAVSVGPFARRLVVFLVASAGYHLLAERSTFGGLVAGRICASAHAWTRSALLFLIVLLEADTDVIVVAWAALVAFHALVANLTRQRVYLQQAAAGALLVALRAMTIDVHRLSRAGADWLANPWLTVSLAAGLVLTAMPISRRMRIVDATARAGILERLFSLRPDRVFFFAALLMMAELIGGQGSGASITIGWGAEGVSAFLVALWMRERAFRLAAIGLLLVSVLRVVAVDIWQLQQQGRYVAFIALGSVLLLVSFLYSRYRARLDDYFPEA